MSLFFKIPFDKKQIELAIESLELQTSAELRVYIERKKKNQHFSAFEQGLDYFNQLEMFKTEAKNGVLIYIAYKDQQCAIIGDQGIHQYVTEQFWQQQNRLMIDYFKQKKYNEGLINIIANISKELARYFPYQENDKNELDNEVIIK
ncbi:putative membrane protein [Bisgaardia hudsonensis]|uniref:Putative membrane protein n=1 Tax=Bisgaardia hudsonensis TaxID=109472 RepID=A0A4R2N0X2_9PAST|nr:TPM domain-containing protein [Bisgaardia hudsonensis]QLB13219.1 hypothetical protein A6A11_06130 [Bisgaardia hudsonensis]TCP13202.1 putative membrane protein [Bisgaardia hudsonensis]